VKRNPSWRMTDEEREIRSRMTDDEWAMTEEPETMKRPSAWMPTRIARALEDRLAPLEGAELTAARDAILDVYTSGKAMTESQWATEYDTAITSALRAIA
jgi:hypothetical protein